MERRDGIKEFKVKEESRQGRAMKRKYWGIGRRTSKRGERTSKKG